MKLTARQLQAIGMAVVLAGWPAVKAAFAVYEAWTDLQERVEKLERRACKLGGHPPDTIDWQRECKP